VAAARKKETVEEEINTAATTVNSVAKVFNAEAGKGLAGVILAVVAAAIIVSTIAIVANTVATNKNTKAKQAKAAQDEKNA